MFRSVGVAALTGLLVSCAGAALAAPPPASAFGRLPEIQTASLSPGGGKIALLGGSGADRVVSIAPVDGEKALTIQVGKVEVTDLQWAGDGYVLIRSSVLDRGVDRSRGRKYAYHIARDFVASAADGRIITYLLKDSVASGFLVSAPTILRIVGGDKPVAFLQGFDWSDSALLPNYNTRMKQSDPLAPAIWRVDIATGSGRVVDRGDPHTDGWLADARGEARVMTEADPALGIRKVLTRAKGSGDWKLLEQTTDEDANPLRGVLGYSDPEDAVYLRSTGADGSLQIVRHGLADGAETVIPLQGRPAMATMRFDPVSGAPLAVIRGGTESTSQWIDPQFAAADLKLSRALKGRPIELRQASSDRTRFLVLTEGPDTPAQWFLLDTAKGQLSPVGEAYPELEGADLGRTSWYVYAARDGLKIPASLTLPSAAPGGGKPPLVVLPHDGPGSRDGSDFDWLDQYLATRGYAVLRPQYRGSSGFGSSFETAGRKEMNGKMQTDILDGVADLASKGVIDPARVCIIGRGFGGYAALAGAALHPDAYRCAASINGYSDVALWLHELTDAYAADSGNVVGLEAWVGHHASDAAVLAQQSPAEQAANVRAPILLIASTDDTDAPMEQSVTMQAALQKAGKPVEFVTLQGDDNLSTAEARTKALEAVGAFLAKNLPVTP